MAILAGDALLTMAFDLCSRPDLMKGCDPARQVRLIRELAYGSGNMGMVGGQVFDIQAENKDIDLLDAPEHPQAQDRHVDSRSGADGRHCRRRMGSPTG